MWFHVLACDYDGTLASEGRIAPETMEALERVRASGRRVILITGRQFDDLLTVCPEVDLFDLVVAENGAVLFEPRARHVENLAAPPPATLFSALEREGVPFSRGRVVVATIVPHEVAVLRTIRALGLELHIVFNRDAVMVLPSGISKESGLRAALRRLEMSPHNTVGVGDAENDHTFLACAGFAVAVANAVPALAAAVDLVTKAPNGAGVRELIDGPLLRDLADYRARVHRRAIELGRADEGAPLTYPVFGPNLLITGTSARRTAALAGAFVERLVREGCEVCLLDAEGEYRTLAARLGIVVLEGETATGEPGAQGLERLRRERSASFSIDLRSLGPKEKVRAAGGVLRSVQRRRARTGAPHWVVIGAAHRVFPAEGRPSLKTSGFDWTGVCLITHAPRDVAPDVLGVAGHALSTSVAAVTQALPLVPREQVPGGELAGGEALDVKLADGKPARVRRFQIASTSDAGPGYPPDHHGVRR